MKKTAWFALDSMEGSGIGGALSVAGSVLAVFVDASLADWVRDCRKECEKYGRKMAALPGLREQDPLKTAAGHAAYQLPAVLS